MSFPWSYSVLGLVPGLILTVVIAMIVLYTSLVIWYVFSIVASLVEVPGQVPHYSYTLYHPW